MSLGGEPIRDGVETKQRETIERVRASRFEKAFMVELGVDEGDVEAPVVQ
ncbi:hypothetical protein SLEP1_g48694 [Rubroshorea leprosula]|uniref:Uncharacterized protein n=1 Tax=Rubroshorea leprosula TaxID=152421 RepID=A0AAV5LXB7_9ROSI|nr:hypothetical protein SLEP1_g48694 [Rubroshorea leprosula]